jgi:multidrug transporter EmrE-like cation transporter
MANWCSSGKWVRHGTCRKGGDKILFLLQQFFNPWIISGLFAAFLASLAWMAAMTRFELNYAYPFMSLAFVIVMIFSAVFLNEPLTPQGIFGTLMVVGGAGCHCPRLTMLFLPLNKKKLSHDPFQ